MGNKNIKDLIDKNTKVKFNLGFKDFNDLIFNEKYRSKSSSDTLKQMVDDPKYIVEIEQNPDGNKATVSRNQNYNDDTILTIFSGTIKDTAEFKNHYVPIIATGGIDKLFEDRRYNIALICSKEGMIVNITRNRKYNSNKIE